MLNKKTITLLLKFGIAFFAFLFLFKQLTDRSTLVKFNNYGFISQIYSYWYVIVVVFFMMFINWSVEALKWRFLIKKIENVSILGSLRAVFAGITVSAFTPNRVGEYGGRVFCLEKADRIQGVLITVIGSMAQLLTTVIFGLIGIGLMPKYLPYLSQNIFSVNISPTLLLLCVVIISAVLVFFFLNISYLSRVLSNIRMLENYNMYNTVFSFYNKKELLIILFFSILRYIVFSTQFFILLLLFDVNINFYDALVLIPTMFFIISIIPSIAIAEIGVRGSVAIFLFGLVSVNKIGIISATFTLWVINLLIPTLIGVIFIFTLNFFRR